jgi:hypothetical protein
MGNKYDRKVWDKYEDRHAVVDVYRVLDAFQVTCPATAHAVKKLLCAGIRGHKDNEQDLAEAAQSIEEARAMVKQKRRAGGTRPETTPEPQVQPLPHKFAIGDNVMCLANGTYTQARHPILVQFIESGECGVVVELQNDGVVVQFENPPRLVCMPSTHIDKLVKRGATNG